MERLTRWQVAITAAFTTAFLIIAILSPILLSGGEAAAAVNCTSEETRMLQLVNEARNNIGLPSLFIEQQLVDFARSYSSEMIQYDFFAHVSPVSGDLQQRIAARGINGWQLAGENIAKAPNVEVAFNALMESPTHRENILRAEFNCLGIGIVQGSDALYISQEFMQFSNIPSSADVPITPEPESASSPDSFDSYLLVMNPNDTAAKVDVVFQSEDGGNHSFHYTVGANSRFTVPVRETIGCCSFAADVSSDIPVLAERAMYFSYRGRNGGHDSIGASQPSNTWFFAEGYTGDSFDTWVLLQNPNDSAAAVTLNFMRPDGSVVTEQVSVPARRRHSVHVDEVPGLESSDVSTQVTSNLPVVAERSMYFDYEGKDGGHDSIGASQPSNTWFFAEGYTGDSFDTWVLLQNPNDSAAAVTLNFMRPDGSVVTEQVSVPARRRHSVHVDEVPGLESSDVSTQVTSNLPVVAERSMYFDYQNKKGGHASIGAPAADTEWYLAEGYTGESFDEYVLLLNPGDTTASVDVIFVRPDGYKVIKKISMPPHSRYTVHVDEVAQLEASEVSTKVLSDRPIVVERAQYFEFRGLPDGTNSVGSKDPSTTWYFAEGCVK
ncbi:MAG: DUF5719 family protein [Actinomycetota bacterium]|nr:DUF5719 family protein [Actinomycetota bacterium]